LLESKQQFRVRASKQERVFFFEFSEGGVCIIHVGFGEAEPVSGASVVVVVVVVVRVGHFKF
jgi:hypothetical protein